MDNWTLKTGVSRAGLNIIALLRNGRQYACMPYTPDSSLGKAIVAFCADKKMPYQLDNKMVDECFGDLPVDGNMPKHGDDVEVLKNRFAVTAWFREFLLDLIGGGVKDNLFSDEQLENPNKVEDPFDRIDIERRNSVKKALERIKQKRLEATQRKEAEQAKAEQDQNLN